MESWELFVTLGATLAAWGGVLGVMWRMHASLRNALGAELRSEIGRVREELGAEIAGLRAEIAGVRTELGMRLRVSARRCTVRSSASARN